MLPQHKPFFSKPLKAAESQRASGEENRRNVFWFGQFGGSLWAHYLTVAQEEQCNSTALCCSASACAPVSGKKLKKKTTHIFRLSAWACSPLVRLSPRQVNELIETPPHDAVCLSGVHANIQSHCVPNLFMHKNNQSSQFCAVFPKVLQPFLILLLLFCHQVLRLVSFHFILSF